MKSIKYNDMRLPIRTVEWLDKHGVLFYVIVDSTENYNICINEVWGTFALRKH